MDASIIAAIIASSVAALTGIANIILTIHRSKQDGIVSYRMKWIDNVREEFSNILSWIIYTQDKNGRITINPINNLRKSVYLISLYLNVKDDYDQKILKKTFEYLEKVTKAYQTLNVGSLINLDNPNDNLSFKLITLQDINSKFEESEKIKQELHKLIRVYLKTEWTRVKAESSIIKFRYRHFWSCIHGFKSNKAIEKFSEEYKDF